MANHPHNSKRPERENVIRALENDDIEALKLALTVRQKRFAEEYVVDFDKTAAAVRAGYSKSYADRQGYLLFRHKGIRYYIDHLLASKEAKIMSVNPDYVLSKVTEIISREGARDSDKLRGLELLARHLGMLKDKTEITGKDGGPLAVEQKKIEEDSTAFITNLKALKRPNLKVVND